jgi:hypothetical protein
MSTVVLVGGAARMAGYASYGFYGGSTITLLAVGLPLVIVGSWVGRPASTKVQRSDVWMAGGRSCFAQWRRPAPKIVCLPGTIGPKDGPSSKGCAAEEPAGRDLTTGDLGSL